ncbi:MAG: phosphate-starvation-inducible PsiE family protein [Parachlamydiaceae bacterium]
MSDIEVENKIVKKDEPLVNFLNKMVVYAIKALAIMMIILIFSSVIDVAYVFYDKMLSTQPLGILHIDEILVVLGAFIAVLIAVEIFHNIILYLRDDKTHIKLVLATAVIAVSRKVIILDYSTLEPAYIYATAAVVLATAMAYWLVSRTTDP